jgi:hypothetical protein
MWLDGSSSLILFLRLVKNSALFFTNLSIFSPLDGLEKKLNGHWALGSIQA